MTNWNTYRLLLRFTPRPRLKCSGGAVPGEILSVYKKYRVPGFSLATFDTSGTEYVFSAGLAGKKQPVTADTLFRCASVSKHITAMGIMKLIQDGLCDPDEDVNRYLPFPLRHPKAPDTPITLRMLITHTAGIHDGAAYQKALADGGTLSGIMRGDSYTEHTPGKGWEYSNLGAGIAGCVLEGMTGKNFDTLMKEVLFDPLGVRASYYPQRLGGRLADAVRVFPKRSVCYDAKERLARALPADMADPEHHYVLAHGNLCISSGDMAVLGHELMCPGFLTKDTLAAMRRQYASFGSRAKDLCQGMGTFILNNPSMSENTLYGHQGLAYGAVHGIFYDPAKGRGFVSLTTGAGEARNGVMTDLNADLIRLLL